MLEKYGGLFEVNCDFCCGEAVETGCDDFMEAVAFLKDNGWKIFKKDGQWHHKGPSCQEEDNEVSFDAAEGLL